jgi:3-phosphoshikimate 1-carboxyvinyltransferase
MDRGVERELKLEGIPSRRLRGDVEVPGDKSMSHRALILAGLAEGQSVIHGLLESHDVLRTASAVQTLGASISRSESGNWIVRGKVWRTPDQMIDCGNSGTSARLLMGAVAGFPLIATFTGDSSLNARPMNRVVDPLSQMGARFDRQIYLPITVHGGNLKGICFKSPIASAQVKSAILLAGLQTDENIEVIEPQMSRDHTERMLILFGCDVDIGEERGGRRVRLGNKRSLQGRHIIIPGDISSAAFALVAALITPDSEVTLRGVLNNPGRNGFLAVLHEMGANIEIISARSVDGIESVDIIARSSSLKGVRVPAARVPSMVDEYPLLAVAAAFACGETVMEGLSELRVKESDRLEAIDRGLRQCGVDAKIHRDALHVHGDGKGPRGGAVVTTNGDHRIAMAFLILGLGAKRPVIVTGAEMIATSFPDFADFMGELGAEICSC